MLGRDPAAAICTLFGDAAASRSSGGGVKRRRRGGAPGADGQEAQQRTQTGKDADCNAAKQDADWRRLARGAAKDADWRRLTRGAAKDAKRPLRTALCSGPRGRRREAAGAAQRRRSNGKGAAKAQTGKRRSKGRKETTAHRRAAEPHAPPAEDLRTTLRLRR